MAPFAHDGEGDLTRINGSQRDYLLTAHYTHTFTWTEERSLGLSLGLIDSTGWLDENAYAADELGQFMNDALVHNPVLNLPAYDHGGAAHFQSGNWSVNGLALHLKSDDEVGRHFDYYGLQLGWQANLPAGEGNYRLIAYRTTADFLDPTGNFSALTIVPLPRDKFFSFPAKKSLAHAATLPFLPDSSGVSRPPSPLCGFGILLPP